MQDFGRRIVAIAILAVVLWGLSRPLFGLPALGETFNPFTGLWQTPAKSKLRQASIKVDGLEGSGRVEWDQYRVPHIQAENVLDVYRLQGFVHASQRMFQMDIQARAGGGRLSELLGRKTLSFDRFFIGLGLRTAARNSLNQMTQNLSTKNMIDAYVAGINAWIESLKQNDWPTEYRLLGVGPARWTPMQVAELFATMGFNLSGRTNDLFLTRLLQKFPRERITKLFPDQLPEFLSAPFADSSLLAGGGKGFGPWDVNFKSRFGNLPEILRPMAGNGSNNWAVSPQRSATGSSILANDTHLGLTLPAIWFEQELRSKDLHVYGGGFAGVPGVLVGFNQNIAWGVTNGTTDVVDWYEMPLSTTDTISFEPIQIRGEAAESLEMRWTEMGPVVEKAGLRGLVIHWTLHEGGDPLQVFTLLNRANKFAQCEAAITSWSAPIQNFICADKNEVSITHAGKLPIRKIGQGRFVMNGEDKASHWQGYWPQAKWPKRNGRVEGFVASANEPPLKFGEESYLGWESEMAYRARRIFAILRSRDKWSAQEFMNLQLDNFSLLASEVLPILLRHIRQPGLSDVESSALEYLKSWDFKYASASVAASLFHEWWRELAAETWADQLGVEKEDHWPSDERLQLLIMNERATSSDDQYWVDDVRTVPVESINDLAGRSFSRAVANLSSTFGSLRDWEWGKVRPLIIPHVGRFPGFGIQLKGEGSKHTLNATQSRHGPGWRMVVQLGDAPRAWTLPFGSTAGEPLSQDYRRGIEEWRLGQYKEVLFSMNRLTGPGVVVWDFVQLK
jgi:penicillin G amidase